MKTYLYIAITGLFLLVGCKIEEYDTYPTIEVVDAWSGERIMNSSLFRVKSATYGGYYFEDIEAEPNEDGMYTFVYAYDIGARAQGYFESRIYHCMSDCNPNSLRCNFVGGIEWGSDEEYYSAVELVPEIELLYIPIDDPSLNESFDLSHLKILPKISEWEHCSMSAHEIGIADTSNNYYSRNLFSPEEPEILVVYAFEEGYSEPSNVYEIEVNLERGVVNEIELRY